jgi:hypothetical protein
MERPLAGSDQQRQLRLVAVDGHKVWDVIAVHVGDGDPHRHVPGGIVVAGPTVGLAEQDGDGVRPGDLLTVALGEAAVGGDDVHLTVIVQVCDGDRCGAAADGELPAPAERAVAGVQVHRDVVAVRVGRDHVRCTVSVDIGDRKPLRITTVGVGMRRPEPDRFRRRLLHRRRRGRSRRSGTRTAAEQAAEHERGNCCATSMLLRCGSRVGQLRSSGIRNDPKQQDRDDHRKVAIGWQPPGATPAGRRAAARVDCSAGG